MHPMDVQTGRPTIFAAANPNLLRVYRGALASYLREDICVIFVQSSIVPELNRDHESFREFVGN